MNANRFAPNLFTDDMRDPTAYGVGGVLMFICTLVFFINWPTGWNSKVYTAKSPDQLATKSGWLSLFPLMSLMSIQIAAWVQYRILLSDYSTVSTPYNGYIYARDILALSLSILSFVFVAVNGVINPNGFWMAKAKGNNQMALDVKIAMFYFNYIFWTAFFAITSGIVYTQFQHQKDNAALTGTNPANMETLVGLTLAMGVVMIVSLYVYFINAFDKLETDRGEIRSTVYHGIVPMCTVSQKMNTSFMIATTLYSSAVMLLVYADIYQFSIAAYFLNGVALMATVVSKDTGTYVFYFAYTLWFLTTVSYVTTDAVELVTVTGVIGDWSVPAANAGGMQLGPSKIVLPVNFAPTLNLVIGLGFAGCISYMASVFLKFPNNKVTSE